MIIIVDTNEESTAPRIVDDLKSYYGKSIVIANLNAGDINIPLDDGSVLGIDRKEAHDFLASIADRRVFNVIERMFAYCKYVAIVITGKITYDENDMVKVDGKVTNWNGASIRATLRVIQLSGCVLEYCPVDKYPQIIEEMYKTVNKPDERQGLKRRRIVTFPPLDTRVETLALFPGVGLKRAESLLRFAKNGLDDSDEYGSLAKAIELAGMMVLIDKDIRPEGWGAKTILNFRKFMGYASNECLKLEIDKGD